jgi:galactonate dehydratase
MIAPRTNLNHRADAFEPSDRAPTQIFAGAGSDSAAPPTRCQRRQDDPPHEEAVRSAVGASIDLMIEVHGRLNVPAAIAMARALAKYDPRWFEEPVPPESIDALADVRANSPVAIATGERYFEPERFMELIYQRAVDIPQPDVGHVGGILEAQKIAAMAHARFLPVAPHNPTGPVTNAMTMQLAATLPNFCILETIAVDVPWRREIVRESLTSPTARSASRMCRGSVWN